LIAERIVAWNKYADFVFPGAMIEDGLTARVDVMLPSLLCIDQNDWFPPARIAQNGRIKFIHYPNHRGFKGTELIINAFENVRARNATVDMTLDIISGVSNSEIKALLDDYDVLIEQLLFIGYAQSAIEGMAKGLAVISNLGGEDNLFHAYRVFGSLSNCPIISATPSTIEARIQELIANDDLIRKAAHAGPGYVDRYHSLGAIGSFLEQVVSFHDIEQLRSRLMDCSLPYAHSPFVK
jgi:hypothetical protein